MSATKERAVYPRINGGQTCQDDKGWWWVRYPIRVHATKGPIYSQWVPHTAAARPKGTSAVPRMTMVELPV